MSLVAFAETCDWLGYAPGSGLKLEVEGPNASGAGPVEGNLVLRAARNLAERVSGLALGRFRLIKRLPAAAGIGGGSADAAAALRALAEENGLSIEDERLRAAAADTGADVPVCLFSRARVMLGVGDRLGPIVALPEVFAVLVNPRVVVPTRQVFEALTPVPETKSQPFEQPHFGPGLDAEVSLASLVSSCNDLQQPAIRLFPAIGGVLEKLSSLPGALAARMSGSGATCFALFGGRRDALAAHKIIVADQPDWWVKRTCFH